MNHESRIRNRKLVLVILASCFLLLASTPALAQTLTDYELLAPIPLSGLDQPLDTTTKAGPYIAGIFTLIIAIAGGLAVLRIIFGGIKYMSTDAFGEKSEAKNIIETAIWGLLLAMSAWLILYTINPKLVNFDFSIPVQPLPSPIIGPSAGQPWPDDSATRSALEGSGIVFNKNNCVSIGDTECTSVYNLNSSTVSELQSLKQNCNCTLIITGGTEYWIHGNRSTEIDQNPTQHKPGGSVVDLDINTNFTNYLRTQGARTQTYVCSNVGSEKYNLNGAIYVNEVTHWHVCF
ncbi:MAG: TrbC/VirB2 family protein [Candidatus Zambryskibacteria bacterium]|nr:TrbC/VirB2 family protein [Candidatus Zambryskibacteria bacterium]